MKVLRLPWAALMRGRGWWATAWLGGPDFGLGEALRGGSSEWVGLSASPGRGS